MAIFKMSQKGEREVMNALEDHYILHKQKSK